MQSSKAILVSGSHRSGTTWVGKMLCASPSIAYINEPFSPLTYQNYRGRCGAKFIHWNTYITNENESEFYSHLKNTLEFNYNFMGQLQSKKNLANFKLTIKEYLQFLGYKYQHKIPLLKDPLALFSIPWLVEKFDINVIILIRHPAAFVSSIKRVGWQYNFAGLLEQPFLMKEHLSSFEEEINEYAHTSKNIIDSASLIWKIMYYLVSKYQEKYQDWIYQRYEDIAKEPIMEFKNLFQKLDLEYSESVKNTIKDYTNTSNITNSKHKDWSFQKRNSIANVTSWKNNLTSEEIKQIRNKVEPISHKFYSDLDW
jgi:hypothetical protein